MPQAETVRVKASVLRDLMTRRGLTCRHVAQTIGRSQKSLEKLRLVEGKPLSLVFAYQIANAIGVHPSDFTDAAPDEDTEAGGAQAA